MSPNDVGIMEFAHKLSVNVSSLARKGQVIDLISNQGELARLAQNHDLVAVLHFEASFHLTPRSKGQVHLNGHFTARLVQNCVISGEPITQQLRDDFTLLFVPRSQQTENQDDDDRLEFFDGHSIDLGAVVEEFFELALDPYPRKDGAEFIPVQIGEAQEEDKPVSPFAALKK